jgi:WD domain, G-beta repeat
MTAPCCGAVRSPKPNAGLSSDLVRRAWLSRCSSSPAGRSKKKFQAVRRRNRQLRSLALALSVLLVIALFSAALARRQTRNAQAQTRLAISRQLITQANATLDDDPRTALLLGIAAQRIHDAAETRANLVNSLVATRYAGTLSGHHLPVNKVALSPDGRTLATGSDDKSVILWDLTHLNALRGDPVERACALTGRGLNRDEWTAYIPGLPTRTPALADRDPHDHPKALGHAGRTVRSACRT